MRRYFVLLLIFVLLVAGVYALTRKSVSSPTSPAPTTSTVAIGQRTKTSGCQRVNALPDNACTPGAVNPSLTKDILCDPSFSTKSVRNVPTQEKDVVYHEYGVASHSPGQYEVDHLISLELGGSNDIANLWPEAAEPRPGFHEKDLVENYLHRQVCRGAIPLATAQQQIANDWLSVYKSISNIRSYR